VNLARRRAFLEDIAANAESDHIRLRALDLMERLDERDRPEPPRAPDFAETYADDPERLAQLVDMTIAHGFFDSLPSYRESIERRAEEIVEERARAARESFAVVAQEAQDAPEGEEVDEEPVERSQGVREREDAPPAASVYAATLRRSAGEADDRPSMLSRRRNRADISRLQ
jgi:hypothetical protein